MNHGLSAGDRRFREEFEAGRLTPAEFNHRAHVRLAYVYLAEHDTGTAIDLMRGALQGFLRQHGIPETKYHETLTVAFMCLVNAHRRRGRYADWPEFARLNPELFDSRLLRQYYDPATLASPLARTTFVLEKLRSPVPAA